MEIGIIVMGLMVGFLVGVTGVGGAALMTPILMMIGINPTVAVGTDLFYNSVTKLFGTIQHWRQRTVNGKIVLYLALGSIPGAVLAIGVLQIYEFYFQNQEQLIKHIMGYILIIIAGATIIQTFYGDYFRNAPGHKDPLKGKRTLTIVIGSILGFIVGLTSIGSGSLFALVLMYIYRIRISELVGTDIAHAFFLVTVAGIFHAGLGHVDFFLAANLLIGSIPGVMIGSAFSPKLPSKLLRALMASIILLSAIKLILS